MAEEDRPVSLDLSQLRAHRSVLKTGSAVGSPRSQKTESPSHYPRPHTTVASTSCEVSLTPATITRHNFLYNMGHAHPGRRGDEAIVKSMPDARRSKSTKHASSSSRMAGGGGDGDGGSSKPSAPSALSGTESPTLVNHARVQAQLVAGLLSPNEQVRVLKETLLSAEWRVSKSRSRRKSRGA